MTGPLKFRETVEGRKLIAVPVDVAGALELFKKR
jgi:hypothetical protein